MRGFLSGLLPNEFLTGFSAAAGIAFINLVGNLGGSSGHMRWEAIKKITGGFNGGLVFAGISWFISTMLLIAFPRGAEPDAAVGVVAGG